MAESHTISERWLPVVGYEGYYEISDHGRVRSLDWDITDSRGRQYTRPGKVRKQSSNRGYPQVTIMRGGRRDTRLVHNLVLEAFVGPRPDGFVCCHNDGNQANSHVDNLRWDTPSENNYDRTRHGTCHSTNKTHCPRGHMLVEPNLVLAIKKKGGRTCLACGRARSYVRYHTELKPHLQKISDSYYEKIMA